MIAPLAVSFVSFNHYTTPFAILKPGLHHYYTIFPWEDPPDPLWTCGVFSYPTVSQSWADPNKLSSRRPWGGHRKTFCKVLKMFRRKSGFQSNSAPINAGYVGPKWSHAFIELIILYDLSVIFDKGLFV